MRFPSRVAPLALAWLLAGCGQTAAPPAATVVLPPLTATLAPVYARSCANCHTNPATGAPLAGDRAAWTPRLAKGGDVLLEHTVNGFNGMPPMGGCADCSEDQYRALIAYMAGVETLP